MEVVIEKRTITGVGVSILGANTNGAFTRKRAFTRASVVQNAKFQKIDEKCVKIKISIFRCLIKDVKKYQGKIERICGERN